MGVKIHRTRKTRMAWRVETEKIQVVAGRTPPGLRSNDPGLPALLIDFMVDAAGGGWTRLAVSVTPDDFGLLFAAMLRVDPSAARAAFEVASKEAPPRSGG